jgi:hypothetical protein
MPDGKHRAQLTLNAEEAKCLRIALIFGDPSAKGEPDPRLEAAKGKLRAIEARAAS